MLYPLVFEPILKERVWGGRDLALRYGKTLPSDGPAGEAWEISDRPEGVSRITNGPLAGRDLRWLMTHHAAELLGQAAAPQGRFPLLVKILDAQELLSVQVHPPAERAAELRGEPKTEMWYITHARPGAEILAGLRPGVGRAEFAARIADGTVGDCVARLPVQPGDAMFLPSGRVHALGAGLMIFEIQQNSDTTYRVFDWNRVGADGRSRELHVAQAMASIDFEDHAATLVIAPETTAGSVGLRRLVKHPLFDVTEIRFAQAGRQLLTNTNRPIVLGVVSGFGRLEDVRNGVSVELKPGQFCLIPACVDRAEIGAESGLTLLTAEPG